MGKFFGTDGIRGIVGETLTADLAFRTGKAVATVLQNENKRAPFIVIGKDTRISSDMLEAALTAGICAMGGTVMPVGVMPTPAVAFLTVQEKADAGIVISASHNPYEHNGIKVFNEKGYKLSDALEAAVEELILSNDTPDAKFDAIGTVKKGETEAHRAYVAHLASSIKSDLSGLRILVDCSNGASGVTAPDLFSAFRCTADFIHCEPNGVNINDHCGSTHLEDLQKGVVDGKYDIGVAFDGDADRCLLVDETGDIIDGDQVLAVCAADMRERGTLKDNAIVATVMSNLGLHEYCKENGFQLFCTNVGDRHVLEKMLDCGYGLGGEQSGHTIFSAFATTGDGELTALQFLQILAEKKVKASALCSVCKRYPQVLVNVKVSGGNAEKERILQGSALQEAIDREIKALNGEGRVLVRPSGTEPLIRVMVEAKTEETARAVAGRLAEQIN